VTQTGSVAPSLQLNYAWQVIERKTYLYVELPLVVPFRESGTVTTSPTGTVTVGNAGPDVFFTPGLRLKISPQSRVSFYGAAGVGIASFGAGTIKASPSLTSVTGGRENSVAMDFGGGIDLRLTRLLSLRGDVRDFVTRAGLGDVSGRNHGIFQVGIAFHF
jgi:opacity protein-like surface antigen